ADIILITRSDLADTAAATEHAVREWNEHAPVFRAATRPVAWIENRSGHHFPPEEAPFGKVAAFSDQLLRTIPVMVAVLVPVHRLHPQPRQGPPERRLPDAVAVFAQGDYRQRDLRRPVGESARHPGPHPL